MRYLVFLLIFANLALFAWYQRFPVPPPAEPQPGPLPPGFERLVLLAERPVLAEQPTPDVEAATIQEQTAEAAAPELQPDTETGAEPVSVEPERVCQTVGPLLDKGDADSISKLLSRQGYQPSMRDGESREPTGYWVYLPAMPAREARRIVADLDANGMKDYFIGKQNYISLGIFSDKGKARIRLKKIEKLGYDAVLDRRYRTRTVHWLDIEASGQPLLDSQAWKKIQEKHADIRVQRVSCE